jgi:retron-type reverse transcriptase
MKRLGQVWHSVVAFENLLLAYRKARKGKARSPDVARFSLNLEQELLALQAQLNNGTYQPGAYRLFTIYERKPRLIAAAPFRDRVVHHAILNRVEPVLDRRFIDDSYACRKGKGVHAALDRYQTWAGQYTYALQMDVQRYFPSIDHGILKQKLRRYIKDQRLLMLLDRIIDTSPETTVEPDWFCGDKLYTPFERRRSIPIGNLTSQFFANLYLDDLDHYIKETLHCRAYLRYVDDMLVLGNSKAALHEVKEAVRNKLALERLRLHPHKAHIMPISRGLDLLGYRLFPDKRFLRNDNGHRFARKLRRYAKAYNEGRMQWKDFNPGVQSWIGHAAHADTLGLRRAIFSHTIFNKGIRRMD